MISWIGCKSYVICLLTSPSLSLLNNWGVFWKILVCFNFVSLLQCVSFSYDRSTSKMMQICIKKELIGFLHFSVSFPLPNTPEVTNGNNLVCTIPFLVLIQTCKCTHVHAYVHMHKHTHTDLFLYTLNSSLNKDCGREGR